MWILDNDKPADRKDTVQLIDGSGLWHKMRKSPGSKRKRMDRADINTVLHAYGNSDTESDRSKVFDNDDFGYQTITVERPLRLNFQTSHDRIERVFAEKAVDRTLETAGQVSVRAALEGMDAAVLWKDRDTFNKALGEALGSARVRLSAPQRKALLTGLSERDQTAEIRRDSKGNPESDPQLRDTENVPLKENILEYFAREVTPHVPDSWIDEVKTKTGYEIPFTRHFYKYTPPRPLAEIDTDVERVITEITALFKQVEQA